MPNFVFEDQSTDKVFIYNFDFITDYKVFFYHLQKFLTSINCRRLDIEVIEWVFYPKDGKDEIVLTPQFNFSVNEINSDTIYEKLSYKKKIPKERKQGKPEFFQIVIDGKEQIEKPIEFSISDFYYEDIFMLSNQIVIKGDNHNWQIFFDRETEWLIIGVNEKTLTPFSSIFIASDDCERYRYKTINSALNNNAGLMGAHQCNEQFINKLRENFTPYFIDNN